MPLPSEVAAAAANIREALRHSTPGPWCYDDHIANNGDTPDEWHVFQEGGTDPLLSGPSKDDVVLAACCKTDVTVILEYLDSIHDPKGDVVKDIVEYLNERLGLTGNRRYKYTNKTAQGPVLIRARYEDCLKAGMTPPEAMERLKQAVEWGMRNWFHKPDMRSYIRPGTLFRPKKFDEYV